MHLFLTTPGLFPFDVSLCLIAAFTVLELIGALTVGSPLHFIDNFKVDLDDQFANWLHLGRVPLMVLIIIFLSGFTVSGYLAQLVSSKLLGSFLPTWIGCLVGTVSGFVSMQTLGGIVGKIFPKDQTFAVSETELIGLVGHVVTGTARHDHPAEIKVIDKHGNSHYLMIEPEGDFELAEGSAVVVVKKSGTVFLGQPQRQ